jgi:DNA-binding NtrC family response regulator
MQNYKILFVDDDNQILSIVEQFLTRSGYAVDTEPDGHRAIEKVKSDFYSVVFTDLMMPDIDGMELLKKIKKASPNTEVVIVTGHGSIETAIEAMKLGGYDFLQKPINFNRFKILIDRIIEKQKLEEENRIIRNRLKERYRYDELVGMSAGMQKIYETIDKISSGSPTVLIKGESGTGKELTANVIHNNSDRKSGPFIPVNCGAISESLLERELFGHVKGAFTGALKDSIGLFKAADGGTIFLDEIGEISPPVQVSLLRVLQEKKVRPVGDTKESGIDVRVIAATNKKLRQAIIEKSFREDLYYRLNVVSITMPPLRTIQNDIPLLVRHFIEKHNTSETQKLPKVSPKAMAALLAYPWPGNVRQLENVIRRAYALGLKENLKIEDLPEEFNKDTDKKEPSVLDLNLKNIEKRTIQKALLEAEGNKAVAAKLLGVNTTTVYRKMAKYNIADI